MARVYPRSANCLGLQIPTANLYRQRDVMVIKELTAAWVVCFVLNDTTTVVIRKEAVMNHVKKILAPTDLSKLSLTGLRYAFNLARSFGAEVSVYHVNNRDEIMQFSEQLKRFGNPVTMGRHTESLLEESQGALSHFLRDNLADLLPLVEVRTKVEMGLPYKNIVERAREDGADMIVMSTHGRTGFSHVLLGSVTEKVVRTAPCPVVSIHPEEEGESSERKIAAG